MSQLTEKERLETLPELDNLVAQLPRRGQDRLIGAGYAILMLEGISNSSTEEIQNAEDSTN